MKTGISARSSFPIIHPMITRKIRVLPVAGIVLPLLVLGDINSLLTHNFHSHLVKEAVLFFSRFKSLSLDIMHSLLSCICSYIRLVMQQYSILRLMHCRSCDTSRVVIYDFPFKGFPSDQRQEL